MPYRSMKRAETAIRRSAGRFSALRILRALCRPDRSALHGKSHRARGSLAVANAAASGLSQDGLALLRACLVICLAAAGTKTFTSAVYSSLVVNVRYVALYRELL